MQLTNEKIISEKKNFAHKKSIKKNTFMPQFLSQF